MSHTVLLNSEKLPSAEPPRPIYYLLLFLVFLFLLSMRYFFRREIVFAPFEFHGIDTFAYFAQLRSLYFDGNLNIFSELMAYFGEDWENNFVLNPHGIPTVHWVIGPAILWLPFYSMGHLWTSMLNSMGTFYPVNGFDFPFQASACFGTMVYGLAGIFLSLKLASRYVPPKYAFYGTIFVWIGSPFIFYLLILPSMAHVPSMFTVTLYLYYQIQTWGRKRVSQWMVLGFLSGLMIICRLDSGAYLLTALFEYGYALKNAVEDRGKGIHVWFKGGVLFLMAFFIALSPQLLAWNYYYGNPFGISYLQEGASFNLASPSLDVLFFSSYAGIVPCSPILVFSFAGLFFWGPKEPGLKYGVIFSLIIILWLTSAFGWKTGDTFGYRHIVQSTAVLIIGLSCFYSVISKYSAWSNAAFLISILMAAWGILFLLQSAFGRVALNHSLTWDQIFWDKWKLFLYLIGIA